MQSMTGCGRASAVQGAYEVTAEVRSVNHRFLELNIKMPHVYAPLEERCRKLVQQTAARGKVEVYLTIAQTGGRQISVTPNLEVVRAYMTAIDEAARTIEQQSGRQMTTTMTIAELMNMPDALRVETVSEDLETVYAAVEPVLRAALEQLRAAREAEGERLRADLAGYLDELERLRQCIAPLAAESVERYRQKLTKRLTELLEQSVPDENRIITEAAIVADKTAVDEELVRLESHIGQFRALLDSTEPVGRRMDFFIQEMNREVNTTGSKSMSVEITQRVVDMKAIIEKMREQIQNVE